MSDRMRKPKDLTPDQSFFWQNAGYSYNPITETRTQGRKRCAVLLAEAEHHARTSRWYYGYEIEPYEDHVAWSEAKDAAHRKQHYNGVLELWCVVLYDASGNVLQSLGSICTKANDPTDCRRVCAAELALEAMD